jgi:Lrp/AsnC family leucine-responsive transcriptional regulator
VRTSNRRGDFDRYDVAILSALTTNTRLTTVELAAIVHLSRTAVSRRIASLRENGFLRDSAEVLNYESLGFGVRALIEIDARNSTASEFRKELLVQPEVLNVAVIAGDGLLCVEIIAVDTNHLHRFVSTLQERANTSTKIIFSVERSQLSLIERMQKIDDGYDAGLVSV